MRCNRHHAGRRMQSGHESREVLFGPLIGREKRILVTTGENKLLKFFKTDSTAFQTLEYNGSNEHNLQCL